MTDKQLFVLSICTGQGSPQKAIPFWWDGQGHENLAILDVIQQAGHEILTPDEIHAILHRCPDDGIQIQIVPWRFADLVQIGHRGTTISVPFILHEKSPEPAEPRSVVGQVIIWENDIGLRFSGYNTFDIAGEKAETVAVELWNGELRVVIWNNVEIQDPIVINMENAREAQKEVARE